MKFELTENEMLEVLRFREEQDKKTGTSYYGAIGGVLTYSFTPNGLGTVVKVTHDVTGAVLDLTNMEDW